MVDELALDELIWTIARSQLQEPDLTLSQPRISKLLEDHRKRYFLVHRISRKIGVSSKAKHIREIVASEQLRVEVGCNVDGYDFGTALGTAAATVTRLSVHMH